MFIEPTMAKVLSAHPVIKRNVDSREEYIELLLVYEYDEKLSSALGENGVTLRDMIVDGKIDKTDLHVPMNEYVGTFYEDGNKKEAIKIKDIKALSARLKSPNSEDPNPVMHAKFHLPWMTDEMLIWFARRQGLPIITVFEKVQAELLGI